MKLAWTTAVCALVLVIGVWLASNAPIRAAQKIKTGDSEGRVNQLLGSPSRQLTNNQDLKWIGGLDFFELVDGVRAKQETKTLPKINANANWYSYGSDVGHLVYFDGNNRVLKAFWAGT